MPKRGCAGVLSAAVLGAAVLCLLSAGGSAVAQSCTELSGAPFCHTQRAHTVVGSQVVFPQGPPARRVGNYLVLLEDGAPRLAGGLPPRHAPVPEGARPAGHLIELDRGRDFGAFSFPSGAAGRLSGRP